MYFSKHNESVTFSYTYGSALEVEAKGSVCKEDTDVEPYPNKNWSKEHYRIELTEGITEVGAGFIMVGWHRTDYSNTKLTIRFKNDGTPYLEYDEYTSGISAGNCGGGTYTRDIEPDFYKSETLESFANRLPGYHDVILKNKDLAHLFKA